MLGRIARTAGAASTNLSRSFTTSGGGLSSVQHVSKFYTKAEACPYEKKDFAKTIGGRQLWTVKLDGRTLRTADKHEYFVPSELLARMITMEFYQQHEYIISATLPLVTSHPEKVRNYQIRSRRLPLEDPARQFSVSTVQIHQRRRGLCARSDSELVPDTRGATESGDETVRGEVRHRDESHQR